jgi:hypothetical protein
MLVLHAYARAEVEVSGIFGHGKAPGKVVFGATVKT